MLFLSLNACESRVYVQMQLVHISSHRLDFQVPFYLLACTFKWTHAFKQEISYP
jgi:hypothetical protein